MDANKNVDDPGSKIMRLFAETNLTDLHYHHYPTTAKPATHHRGSHPIDLIICSPLLVLALAHAWILPFSKPPLIKGNHWLLGLDFHVETLLGSRPTTPSPNLLCGVNSQHKQHVHQFCKWVVSQCNCHQLAECTSTLLEKNILAPNV